MSADNDVESLTELKLTVSESDSDEDVYSSDDSEANGNNLELDASPDELLELYVGMETTRFHMDRTLTAKSKEFASQFFDKLPPNMFRQMTRMDKACFYALLSLIENHSAFENEATMQQADVQWQLAVMLDRLGHEGNGACLNRLIPTWGVSHGTLHNFTSRCFVALEDALKPYLQWPVRAERRRIADKFSKKGFPGCVGLIDGTLIPLSQRPKESGECYYDRKCRYSMNAQVVCDHRQKILFLYTGMPGSCSDITCYKRSSLYKQQNTHRLFSRAQYILGDSGYYPMEHMVAAYKRCESNADREAFNMCVAKCRVTNEHCIGVLKSRWHSLREMRVQLKSKEEHVWVVRWIVMCARLHNFVLSQNDIWTEQDQEIILDNDAASDEEEMHTLPRNINATPQLESMTLQASIMDYALQFHRQPGGCLARN
ncbi:unnamed protein product [Calypogeia fissa]